VQIYDTIGATYTRTRRADPRIVETILRLLDVAEGSVVADVGAGTGNYSNALAEGGRLTVHAIEPSPVMRAQAALHPRVHFLAGSADAIPLPDSAVDGVVSTLAIHHFPDLSRAFHEMARIARPAARIVLFTFDVGDQGTGFGGERLWLEDYFPSFYQDDRRAFPPLGEVASLLQTATRRDVEVVPFPLPPDLTDLFLASGWRRPEIYLDPDVQAGISSFALGDPSIISAGLERLREDLDSGDWDVKYGTVRQRDTFDAGYRFLRAAPTS
jgi:ubiquinone/menaquinone biosynthesis C-methylase UbiE